MIKKKKKKEYIDPPNNCVAALGPPKNYTDSAQMLQKKSIHDYDFSLNRNMAKASPVTKIVDGRIVRSHQEVQQSYVERHKPEPVYEETQTTTTTVVTSSSDLLSNIKKNQKYQNLQYQSVKEEIKKKFTKPEIERLKDDELRNKKL